MELPEACPLTGQVAIVTDGEFDGWTVHSSYSGGSYKIARSVIETVRSLNVNKRAKIITWLVDQRRFGDPLPMLTSYTVDAAIVRHALTYDQRVQRFFQMLKSEGFVLGQSLRYSGAMDSEFDRRVGNTSAWLEITDYSELAQILKAMADEGLFREQGERYYLTANGIRKLDATAQSGAESNQAFVAMWFSSAMDEAYKNGFEPGISSNGYQALRIDQKEHSNKIDDEIIAEIRRSRFIVADFTCDIVKSGNRSFAVPRGGVYYEAGFAQGLGVPVIWTVRSDCIEHVHFDTRQYAHIVWNDAADLSVKLKNRIGAVIGPAVRI